MEDSDATFKMCLKGRSPALRYVPPVFRVDLDTMFECILTDPSIKMQYINTKEQLADILTKGSFTAQTWRFLISLFQISPAGEKVVDAKDRESQPKAKTVIKSHANVSVAILPQAFKASLDLSQSSTSQL